MTTDRRDVEELAVRLLVAAYGAGDEDWDPRHAARPIGIAFAIAQMFVDERNRRRT